MTHPTHVILCGGDLTPGPRDPCPNTLHDWPLPAGYVDAHEAAASRLYRGWKSRRCPDCGFYGWAPSRLAAGDQRIPPDDPDLILEPPC